MRVMIIGATSAIAYEAAKCLAERGNHLFLVGRSEAKLAIVRDDLRVRGARQVTTYLLDVTNVDRHPEMLRAAIEALGGVDGVLVAHGVLPDQRACQQSIQETLAAFDTNLISTVALLTLLANYFEEQRRGCIAVITSVAGDRGRKSNYVYGTTKGALNLFLQGLRNRLHKIGVSIVTLKPGFVDTPMTRAMSKNKLFVGPRRVGRSIVTVMERGQDVAYIPWFWRPIMAVLRSIPEPLFKRLDL